jgi:ribosomal protein S18 acetylase RimI-like enzyme
VIRPFTDEDTEAVVDVWHRSGLAVYTFLPTWQTFTREHAGRVFLPDIASRCDVWVGEEGSAVVAYLAMDGSYIDRLYVDPPHQRRGWGTALVDHAKRMYPEGLELHTHQENVGARALYEKLGFVPVVFGVSPPPESAPDVEYHWRPDLIPARR